MAVTQAMLDEAEQAYHRLMVGGGIAEFRDQNGETVKYERASMPRLLAYIQFLRAELGIKKPTGVGIARAWF